MLFFSGFRLGLRGRLEAPTLHLRISPHIDGAHRAVCIHSPRRTFLRTGSRPPVPRQRPRLRPADPPIHNAEKVGFILFTFLVHGLVIINDNVKGIAAAGLYGNKLLVGVLVIEQITGYKVSLLGKPSPGVIVGSGAGVSIVGSP